MTTARTFLPLGVALVAALEWAPGQNAPAVGKLVTVRPGAYPWKNSPNAWRPAHIHFSLFGRAFVQRLVTQMYFPGDPLLAHDAIATSVPEFARDRLVAALDLPNSVPEWALAYRFDLVLRATPFEDGDA